VFAGLAALRIQELTGGGQEVASLPSGDTPVPPTGDPAAAEAALGLDRDARWAIQWVLTRLGYDTRGVDGAFGANTRQAKSLFQADAGLPGTGLVDAATRTALVKSGNLLFGILQAERVAWGDIGMGANEDALREFLARFPDGRYAWEANRQLASLAGQAEEKPGAVSQDAVNANRENVIQSFEENFNRLLANVLRPIGFRDEYQQRCFGFLARYNENEILM
jgi:peptidoglycan hydrolase-like protein with peptidoglycan-binding domain